MSGDKGRPGGGRAARPSNRNDAKVPHWCRPGPPSTDLGSAMRAWRRLKRLGLANEASWHVLFHPFDLCECARCEWERSSSA